MRNTLTLPALFLALLASACVADFMDPPTRFDADVATIALATDRDALVALYGATDGDYWHDNTGWLSDDSLHLWYGVRTDSGAVTRLYLSSNRLRGGIPPELGDLAALESLELARNFLTGEIPPELGDLTATDWLDLSGNFLTGEIPLELGNLADTTYLDLSDNNLTGGIPSSFGEKAWFVLDLSDNHLSGEIPDLNAIESRLDLSGNRLTGTIPLLLGGESIDVVDLSDNLLSGEIPPLLGELSFHSDNGTGLNLSYNLLTGGIPPELGNLTVERLYLAGNDLTGGIPPELGNLSSEDSTGVLYLELDVGGNPLLEGPVPLALAAGLDLHLFRYAGTKVCVQEPGEAVRNWLDSIPNHIGTGLRCVPAFGADFTSGDEWPPPPDWHLVNASGRISDDFLYLVQTTTGKFGYLARGHPLTDWEGRASMEGGNRYENSTLVFFINHFRYRAYALRIGLGAYPGDADSNFMVAILDALDGVWLTSPNLYGTADAISNAGLTEVSVSLRDSMLTVYAGSSEIVSGETGFLPVGLLGYALAIWPIDSDTLTSAKFDWVDVYGTPPTDPSPSADGLEPMLDGLPPVLPAIAIGHGIRQLPGLVVQRR